jgi:glycosyltransferase involved in cell wall biosynthesis
MFRELAAASPIHFEENLIELPAPNRLCTSKEWVATCRRITQIDNLLFSSLTPLENYIKYPYKLRKSQNIGLWFTHKEGDFGGREKRALMNANHIFLHSDRQIEKIKGFTNATYTSVIGAIDQKRFIAPAKTKSEIAWIGTPSARKRPEMLFEIARKLPDFDFRIIGPGWKESGLWEEVKSIQNINVVEINGALSSRDLDGCSMYLMTSKIEGGPMPLLEAVASGLIPIVTDVGFVREVFNLAQLPHELIVSDDVQRFLDGILKSQQMIKEGFRINRQQVMNLTFERMAMKIAFRMLFNKEKD